MREEATIKEGVEEWKGSHIEEVKIRLGLEALHAFL